MLPPPADRPKLMSVLDLLAVAVEELLQGGLTTASESTRSTINAAIQEAARHRWLRLGSSLRGTAEELGRFQRQESGFSRRRLSFFLGRSWLLGRGIAHSLKEGNEREYDRLTWSPAGQPAPELEVVCLGVVMKVAAGSFVAFDFRLRATSDRAPVESGRRLSWSVVFPIKAGVDIIPEGYLHLPQKQKFNPILFLDRKTVSIRNASVVIDENGGGRVVLQEASTVVAGRPFGDWDRFLDWSPGAAVGRIANHRPDPLDLETELQEEVVIRDYAMAPPVPGDEPGQEVHRVTAGRLEWSAVVASGAEGKTATASLEALRMPDADRPPLFGLMHYERCRLAFQPLATFGKDGPDYLNISKEIVNKATLLKSLSFA